MRYRLFGSSKYYRRRIKDSEDDVYKLSTILKSLLKELGYSAHYNLEWGELDGVKKIEKDAENEK